MNKEERQLSFKQEFKKDYRMNEEERQRGPRKMTEEEMEMVLQKIQPLIEILVEGGWRPFRRVVKHGWHYDSFFEKKDQVRFIRKANEIFGLDKRGLQFCLIFGRRFGYYWFPEAEIFCPRCIEGEKLKCDLIDLGLATFIFGKE